MLCRFLLHCKDDLSGIGLSHQRSFCRLCRFLLHCKDDLSGIGLSHQQSFCDRTRPGATGGGISGPCPPNECLCPPPKRKLCPPSEDCAPKKLTGSGFLECKSRRETPKFVFTARIFVIFVDSHQISQNFLDEDLFFLVFT